ncbi:MAG: hypothetical protein QM766_06920 [Burkholderiaceae bacterium]
MTRATANTRPAASRSLAPRVEVGLKASPIRRPSAPAAGDAAARILASLRAVEHERQARTADAGLRQNTHQIKLYQQRRLEASYANLLADRRHAPAVRFLIDELHGTQDVSGREAQIASVVPTLAATFPRELVETVAAFAALHALSESLDTDMARHLRSRTVTPQRYADAWRETGRPADRQRRIDLMVEIGRRMDRHTRDPLLGASLRMMRGPALMTGLGELQRFLEAGFDAFASMRGAEHFVSIIAQRETAFHTALFAADLR